MTTASRTLCRSLLRVSRVTPAKRKCTQAPLASYTAPRRQLSSSSSWRVDETASGRAATPSTTRSPLPDLGDDGDDEAPPYYEPSQFMTPSNPLTADDLNPVERAEYETLPQQKQEEYIGLRNHYIAMLEEPDGEDPSVDHLVTQMDREIEKEAPLEFEKPTRLKPAEIGFWAEDEEDEFGQMEDADDDVDDSMMTAVAESELELHREVRQYTRAAAWDMPLLTKHAKPFDLPATNQVLRFRYTTYMGESHPAEKKVVVEFSTKDLAKASDLSEVQRTKLIKLAGVRYNPDTDVVRMSSEKFEHAAQNKRYLGDLVNKLVREAQNAEDIFQDVPLDFRHHKPKKVHPFPEEWKLTGKRVEELQALRMAEKAPALEAPALEPPPVKKRDEEGARRVAEYVAAMPLGRRDAEIRR